MQIFVILFFIYVLYFYFILCIVCIYTTMTWNKRGSPHNRYLDRRAFDILLLETYFNRCPLMIYKIVTFAPTKSSLAIIFSSAQCMYVFPSSRTCLHFNFLSRCSFCFWTMLPFSFPLIFYSKRRCHWGFTTTVSVPIKVTMSVRISMHEAFLLFYGIELC